MIKNPRNYLKLINYVSNLQKFYTINSIRNKRNQTLLEKLECTLQEEHSVLTGSLIVSQWLSMRIYF